MENLKCNETTDNWKFPTVRFNDTIIFEEPGRVIGNVCYRAFYFRLVEKRFGCMFLLVKHGGGEESICLDFLHDDKEISALKKLTSTERYLMFFTIFKAYRNTKMLLEKQTIAKIFEKRKSRKAQKELMYIKSTIKRNTYYGGQHNDYTKTDEAHCQIFNY